MSQAHLNICWPVLLCLDTLKVDIHWTLDKGGGATATVREVVHWDIETDAAWEKFC